MKIKGILEKQEHFTATDKQIARYILSSPKEVIGLSLEDLATRLYVSKSTIIRFCKKLNFTGHKELCVQLAKELNSFMIPAGEKTGAVSSVEEIAGRIYGLQSQSLGDTCSALKSNTVEEAVEMLCLYRQTICYSDPSLSYAAVYMSAHLEEIGVHSYAAPLLGIQEKTAEIQKPDTVAVVFVSEENKESMNAVMHWLKEHKVPMILMTNQKEKMNGTVLYCVEEKCSLSTCMFFLIEVLTSSVSVRLKRMRGF